MFMISHKHFLQVMSCTNKKSKSLHDTLQTSINGPDFVTNPTDIKHFHFGDI